MNWLTWLTTLVLISVNLHAFVALVLSRGKTAPVLRRLARRSHWLSMGFVVFWVVLSVLAVRHAMSAAHSTEPSARATMLASAIAEGLNCRALGVLGALLPVFTAFWLSVKASRS